MQIQTESGGLRSRVVIPARRKVRLVQDSSHDEGGSQETCTAQSPSRIAPWDLTVEPGA